MTITGAIIIVLCVFVGYWLGRTSVQAEDEEDEEQYR